MTTRFSREAIARARVLVVGDLMLDRYWFGDVERISPEAPVPVCRVTRTEDRLGGAANVAKNVATLGAVSELIGVAGADEAGRRLLELADEAAIRHAVAIDARIPTTIKLRVIGRQQQLLRVDFEEWPSHEILASVMGEYEARLADADVVVLSDYGKGGLTHIPRMIERARAQEKPVVVDPKGTDYARYRGATVITPNRSELAQVVGRWGSECELTDKAQRLRQELGLQCLILTRSEEGMSLYDDEGVQHHAAEAREVFDVSGAGDTVVATLAVLIAAGMSLAKAVPLANKAAGIVVGKLGTASVAQEELFEDGAGVADSRSAAGPVGR